jgi:hypothetical protein
MTKGRKTKGQIGPLGRIGTEGRMTEGRMTKGRMTEGRKGLKVERPNTEFECRKTKGQKIIFTVSQAIVISSLKDS